MVIKEIKKGNLLNAEEKYIVQQCNCVTKIAKGLAKGIAFKYPYADIYKSRTDISIPGTIVISEGDKNIIHMFAQYFPGKTSANYTKYYKNLDNYQDNKNQRLSWFEECLNKIDELNLKLIAIPYKIGCGLAGGEWTKYRQLLDNCKTNIIIYKL